jgi:hypothetical protein
MPSTQAEAWTPDHLSLALAGIISTAVVAGFGAQVWLADRRHRIERRRARYAELTAAYEQAGKALSSFGWSMNLRRHSWS